MFDQLEKIWIEELFEDKIEQLKSALSTNRFNEAYYNDLEAIKSAYEKIKKLF